MKSRLSGINPTAAVRRHSISGRALHTLVADPYRPGSLAQRSRARRFQTMLGAYPDLAQFSVLDLGGRPEFWRAEEVHPRRVVTVNTEHLVAEEPWIEHWIGDACRLSADLACERFDLVMSNSLIEHVGGHRQRQLLADQIYRMDSHYWVQTPYRYFPIEPHYVFPLAQFLPPSGRTAIARHWPISGVRTASMADDLEAVLSIELLGARELRLYFPDCRLIRERILGLTKSIIAIR
jgi:hypothetical protein